MNLLKHGLTVWMAQDEELRNYLDSVLKQMRSWLEVCNYLGHYF